MISWNYNKMQWKGKVDRHYLRIPHCYRNVWPKKWLTFLLRSLLRWFWNNNRKIGFDSNLLRFDNNRNYWVQLCLTVNWVESFRNHRISFQQKIHIVPFNLAFRLTWTHPCWNVHVSQYQRNNTFKLFLYYIYIYSCLCCSLL